jgi:adenylyl- and sulfurtransferase ThiI
MSGVHTVIVHYHELALKGRNRDSFEQQLVGNIRLALKGLGIKQIDNPRSRIRVVLPREADTAAVTDRLKRVCGIANFSLARAVPLDLSHRRGAAGHIMFNVPRHSAARRQTIPLQFDGRGAGRRRGRLCRNRQAREPQRS